MKKIVFPLLFFISGLIYSCDNHPKCDSKEAKRKLERSILSRARRDLKDDERIIVFADSLANLKYPRKTLEDSNAYYKSLSDEKDALTKSRIMKWEEEFVNNFMEYKKKLITDSLPNAFPITVKVDSFNLEFNSKHSDVCFCSARSYVSVTNSITTIYYSIYKEKNDSVSIDFRSAAEMKGLKENNNNEIK